VEATLRSHFHLLGDWGTLGSHINDELLIILGQDTDLGVRLWGLNFKVEAQLL
jgi:hypothetical protein